MLCLIGLHLRKVCQQGYSARRFIARLQFPEHLHTFRSPSTGAYQEVSTVQGFREANSCRYRYLWTRYRCRAGKQYVSTNIHFVYIAVSCKAEADSTRSLLPPVVINYDTPSDADSYLHRVGRAGRFGTKGLAITFVSTDDDTKVLETIQSRFEVAITDLPDTIESSTYSTSRL